MPSHSFVPTPSPIFRPGSIQQNYRIKITRLAPEIIVNLRKDRQPGTDPHARDLLRPDELRYFRQNGKNAVIFIHGFNVEYGHYGQHLELSDWGHDILRNQPRGPRLIRTQGHATTFRDSQSIKQQYANWHTKHPELFRDVDLENLNGSGAYNWFIHMEDNLNRATGKFDRTDYSKYTRIINVTWSGDVFQPNYIAAEANANQAGFALAGLIDQLVREGIAVNLIAHSLGNRVLLVAMNLIGQMPQRKECIAHAFMWQPAVPNTSLSNDPGKDSSVLRNWNFIHAHRAAKKIVVLYSEGDNVLGPHKSKGSINGDLKSGVSVEAYLGRRYKIGELLDVYVPTTYELATRVGVPAMQLIYAPWSIKYLHRRNWVADNLPKIEQAMREQIAKDSNDLFTDHLVPKRYESLLPPPLGSMLYTGRVTREMADDAMKTLRALANAEYEDKAPRPAMGYDGPEIDKDFFIQRLVREGKIVPVDQKLWLFTHSGMRIPSGLLFEKVYGERIMQRILRDTGFGRY